jgi:hypothetical protein
MNAKKASTLLHEDSRLACSCVGSTAAKRVEWEFTHEAREGRKPSVRGEMDQFEYSLSSLYFRGELGDFAKKFRRYRRGRRLFGTEYTLGVGTESIEDGDQIWLLDGA